MKTESMLDRLTGPQKRLALIGGGGAVLAGALLFVLQPQYAAFRQAVESRTVLREATTREGDIGAKLTELEGEVTALRRQLHGDMGNLPAKQLEAFVVGRLQTISWRTEMELVGIEPLAGEEAEAYRETLFRIDLVGRYFDLVAWLENLNAELGFVVIKSFELSRIDDADDDPRLRSSITIASYRVGNS